MKKFTKLAGLVLLAMLAMGVAACSTESDSDSTLYLLNALSSSGVGVNGGTSGGFSGAKYAVGDIVLNDGSTIHYTPTLTLTAEQKAAAIAVIFKVEGGKALGVGLKHGGSGLRWCTSDAKAYGKNITTIQCPPSGIAPVMVFFIGDTDGSDNFEEIATFLGAEDDTNDAAKYPAFYFAKNYSTTATNLGTEYADGWYLPTIAELFDIWEAREIVDDSIILCGGNIVGLSQYWSSTQEAWEYSAYGLDFIDGNWHAYGKDAISLYVRCIRVFN